jgi:SecD/SecF fusion protein
MTQASGTSAWKITDAAQSTSEMGTLVVNFSFDSSGRTLFGDLTKNNVRRPMAIIVNERVISAPTIMTAITGGHGQMTFGAAKGKALDADVRNTVRSLRAGAFPAEAKLQITDIRGQE